MGSISAEIAPDKNMIVLKTKISWQMVVLILIAFFIISRFNWFRKKFREIK
jgi:hypothetical protein